MTKAPGGFLMTNHLGGYMPKDENNSNGDPWTWTPELWDFLIKELNPKILLDVGCGEGHATKWFLDHGISSYGIEGSKEAKNNAVIPQDRFILHDFTTGIPDCFNVQDVVMLNSLVWC